MVFLFNEKSPKVASKTARLESGFLGAVIKGLTCTLGNGGMLNGPESSQRLKPVEMNSSIKS